MAVAVEETHVECFTQGSPLWSLATVLDGRVGPISQGSARRIAHRLPPELWVKNPGLEEAVARAISANARCVTAHLCGELGLPEALPGETRHLAKVWARQRISADALQQVFASAHEVMWAQWFEAIEDAGVSPASRRALHQYVSQFLFSFSERIGTLATGEHERELVSFRPGPSARRIQAVKAILEGHSVDSPQLGYCLEGTHLGMAAGGDGAAGVLQRVAHACASTLLVIPADDNTSTWAWMHVDDSTSQTAQQTLREAASSAECDVGCGRPAAGIEGFKRTHRQAREAARYGAAYPESGLVAYEDVAMEALACHEEGPARQFVADELGRLTGGQRGECWLQTLNAYFVAGQNASAAGASLGVHDQTITNRLRQIEDALGRTVTSRRAELELALRLHRFFGS